MNWLDIGPPIAFDQTAALKASFEWNFNCGPAALAGLLNLSPDQVRPHVAPRGFKGHMNTFDMIDALKSLRLDYHRHPYRGELPAFGLARVQWGGPWLRPGVPPAAAAKFTHWIASRLWEGEMWIYDVSFGWNPCTRWADELVPQITAEVKRCDGTYGFANAIHVGR